METKFFAAALFLLVACAGCGDMYSQERHARAMAAEAADHRKWLAEMSPQLREAYSTCIGVRTNEHTVKWCQVAYGMR